VWDGDWAVLEEYTTGNVLVEKYLQGYHGLVKTFTNNIYYYQDELGSTSHIANASGALLESYQYDLYGKPRVYNSGGTYQPNATPIAKDLQGGARWIPELGLYDDRNRFMSPELGRFLQPDPIGFKGDGSNLYRYCGNDWANRTDPMGLESAERYIIASTFEQQKVKEPFQSDRGAIMSAMFGVYRMQIRNQQQDMAGFTMNGSNGVHDPKVSSVDLKSTGDRNKHQSEILNKYGQKLSGLTEPALITHDPEEVSPGTVKITVEMNVNVRYADSAGPKTKEWTGIHEPEHGRDFDDWFTGPAARIASGFRGQNFESPAAAKAAVDRTLRPGFEKTRAETKLRDRPYWAGGHNSPYPYDE
jgi:RHS repeat-associated protein